MTSAAALLSKVRRCTLCAQHLPLDPRPVLQLHPLARILIAGQAPGRKGAGVTVAGLVTGVASTHPESRGGVVAGVECVGGSCKAGTAPQDACEPHGTHVAGIITSSSYGVAPAAKVLPVRVLADHNGTCSADSRDVARAVEWAADHGARIINISLGTSLATGSVADVTSAIDAAYTRPILVVAASCHDPPPSANSCATTPTVLAPPPPDTAWAASSAAFGAESGEGESAGATATAGETAAPAGSGWVAGLAAHAASTSN